ncbi:MAG: hypothetical protein Q8O92_01425 [Candidatus Latescibacter sp.]|nr:hypothetical protein [Candidatus Latescibacter sp.]
MDNMQDNFRKKLLESEHFNTELREKYNREVHMLFEKKLTAPRKWIMTAMIAVMLGQAALFLYAVIAGGELPLLARVGFGVGVIFALSFAALLFSIVRKGSFNEKKDSNAGVGMVWVFMIIMITLFMIVAGNMRDQVRGIAMVLNGLVFFNIFGVVGMLQNNINQATLKLQEKLLEIELRLAEMKEIMERK